MPRKPKNPSPEAPKTETTDQGTQKPDPVVEEAKQETRIVIQSRIHEADFTEHVLEGTGFQKIVLPMDVAEGSILSRLLEGAEPLPEAVQVLLDIVILKGETRASSNSRLLAAEALVKWYAKELDDGLASSSAMQAIGVVSEYLLSVAKTGIDVTERVRAAKTLLEIG